MHPEGNQRSLPLAHDADLMASHGAFEDEASEEPAMAQGTWGYLAAALGRCTTWMRPSRDLSATC